MHPFCRSSTIAELPSQEELEKEWDTFVADNVPQDMTFDEWLDCLEPTEDGKLVFKRKSVDKSAESGIINYAKVADVFDVKDYSENSNISLQKVVDLLEESKVGRMALSQLSEKGVKPIFDYSKTRSTNRGEQQGNNIKIYVRNIASERVAAQTVVHETTHLYYNIGQNQWAEAVCFAKEKMFLTGRPLTVAERRYIVKLAKENYPEFK